MSSDTNTGATRRRVVLLATLALVLAAAMHVWQPDEPPPPPAAATTDSASARARAHGAPEVRGDSAEREWVETTLRRWNGAQRWTVAFATDSTAEFHEVSISDSSVADVMQAFVHLPALRDSAGTIELLGGPAPLRASLASPVDSLLRAAAEDQTGGCVFATTLPLRRTAGAGAWSRGFVPGMATFVPPTDTSPVAHRGEALRLLGALRDTTPDGAPVDSLPVDAWEEPSLESWRADGLEILVATRQRTIRHAEAGVVGEERQVVIADRDDGAATPFTTRWEWHARSWPDEESSAWVEAAMRVGPRRRFVFLVGYRGKEGGAGSMLARSSSGWREAVSWSWGC